MVAIGGGRSSICCIDDVGLLVKRGLLHALR